MMLFAQIRYATILCDREKPCLETFRFRKLCAPFIYFQKNLLHNIFSGIWFFDHFQAIGVDPRFVSVVKMYKREIGSILETPDEIDLGCGCQGVNGFFVLWSHFINRRTKVKKVGGRLFRPVVMKDEFKVLHPSANYKFSLLPERLLHSYLSI
jgi:hypothetical protein